MSLIAFLQKLLRRNIFSQPLHCRGLFLLATLLHGIAAPGTLLVTNLNDSGPGSFRQAVVDAVSGDSISFSVAGEIKNFSGEIVISNSITIVGPGASTLTIDGNGITRAFDIQSGATVAISGLTMRDCFASSNPNTNRYTIPGQTGASGGAISNAGDLTLLDCILSQNSAAFGGSGGPYGLTWQYGGTGGSGGAIYNSGVLTLITCAVSGNSAGPGGNGAIGSSRSDGGSGGSGGGIYNVGTVNLVACSINGNRAGDGGWGGSQGFPTGTGWFGGYGGNGGGILNASITRATNCTITENYAGSGGQGGTTSSPGPGRAGGSGGGIWNSGSCSLVACTVVRNGAGNGGSGGVWHTTGAGGNGGSGGGLYNTSADAVLGANTILGLNTYGQGGPSTGRAGSSPDIAGSLTSLGYCLVGKLDGGTLNTNHDLIGTAASPLDPGLSYLTSADGTPPFCSLLSVSPARDSGCDGLLVPGFGVLADQRGLPRKTGSHVDIGSTEFQPLVGIQLLGGQKQPGGCFSFSFTNSPDATFQIWASTDLQLAPSNWTSIGIATQSTLGRFTFADCSLTNQMRFYPATAF